MKKGKDEPVLEIDWDLEACGDVEIDEQACREREEREYGENEEGDEKGENEGRRRS